MCAFRIVADENIPQGREAFASLGEVTYVDGRRLTRAQLAGADALIVRSTTKVNEALLDGTPVRFVATATTGTDHIDEAFLAARGIGFASAAGSNARSVVEYIMAVLLAVGSKVGDFRGRTLGVIGHGRIGSAVARLAPALGLSVVACDPPLALEGARDAHGRGLVPLHVLLERADIVTIHVPLVTAGPTPTLRMIGASELALLKPWAWLINTSRGDVVDGAALLRALDSTRGLQAVIDVWENEPGIDLELLRRVSIGTPHVAGYSLDGKLEGTRMVAAAAARHLGLPFDWRPAISAPPNAELYWVREAGAHSDALHRLVQGVYDPMRDDAALRSCTDPSAMPAHFDGLRRNYPVRREFAAFSVWCRHSLPPELKALGFRGTREID